MSFPTFHLLPSAMKVSNQLQYNSAIAYLQDNCKQVEHLFRVAESGDLINSYSLVNKLTDKSLCDGVKSEWLLNEVNLALKSVTDCINKHSIIEQFTPLSLTLENDYYYADGLSVFCEGISSVDINPILISERLRPIIIPLLDRLCWYGNVIPEWSVLDYCGYGDEVEDALIEWRKMFPNIQVDIESGLRTEDDLIEIINENDLYALFCLDGLSISLSDDNDLEYIVTILNQAKSIRSLIPDTKCNTIFCNQMGERLSQLLTSGYYSNAMPIIQWCFSVLNKIREIDFDTVEFDEFFSWQYSENLVSVRYGNLLGFNMGLQPVIESEYQRQMEIGESIGGILSTDSIEKTLPVLKTHQESQHLIEQLINIINYVDELKPTPLFSKTC